MQLDWVKWIRSNGGALRFLKGSTRGIIAGGTDGSRLNLIAYLTISSSGTNVSDFGDLTGTKDGGGANGHSSNQVRGVITGGYGSSIINNMKL